MLLQECACGEPLIDHLRRCPKCGKPNSGYRPSRWRTFWPEVDSLPGAGEATQLGYWAAFLAAALGAAMSLVPAFGVGLAGLYDATIFAVCGVGIWRNWRSAAIVAFLLCVANIVFSLSRGGGIGVLTVFIFIGLANGVRGTFGIRRFSQRPQLEAAR